MGLHFDKIGWKPSIIQYSMGSRFLGDVTLNRTLGQMMKDLFQDGERWALEPKSASQSVVVEHRC